VTDWMSVLARSTNVVALRFCGDLGMPTTSAFDGRHGNGIVNLFGLASGGDHSVRG